MNLTKRWFFVLTLFFIFRVGADSFGVSPAYYEVNFEPGLEKSFVFNFETNNPDLNFEVRLDGDLAQYATLDKDNFSGSSGRVTVTLNLPQKIDVPGEHRVLVSARPVSAGGSGTIGIIARVNGLIRVRVPYPGKYADVTLEARDSNEGEKAEYSLQIFSRGDEEIDTDTRVEVYDGENKLIQSFQLGENFIPAQDNIELNSELDTSNIGGGNYRAVAVVTYAGQEKTAESMFRIGALFLNITNYTQTVKKNELSPFFVDIESSWNDPVENVYAEVSVVGKDTSFLTPSISLEPWQRGKVEGYLDTSNLEAGILQVKIVLYYEGKTTEKIVDVVLTKGNFKFNSVYVILMAVIVVLIVILGWILMRLKKLEGRRGKK